MKIDRLRVYNYAAFHDTEWIDFSTGINLVVGQNNSGKSALLQTLGESMKPNPYRSPGRYLPEQLTLGQADIDFTVSGLQLERAILRSNSQLLLWPIEPGLEKLPAHDIAEIISRFLKNSEISFQSERQSSSGFNSRRAPSHGMFTGRSNFHASLGSRNGKIVVLSVQTGTADNVAYIIKDIWSANVFCFDAQRYSIGKCPHSADARLRDNAANLPAVLFKLQGDRGSLFDLLVSHLREIFPTVRNLSVSDAPDNQLEILVWPTDERLHRELSFGLNQSGTGIAQVLAILTVVLTFDNSVIIVDEINSFLHPTASKTLLRIIQTHYAHHQYIISTHSPDVISSSNPATLHIVQRSGYRSTAKALDLRQLDQLRQVADDLGVSMSDVFAAERIIWVEGQTEERCFPILIAEVQGRMPKGLTVAAVVATGDFEARNRGELVFQIYDRISNAASPLLKSVVFTFDREGLDEAQMNTLISHASGKLLFLPRRHFECFLIDADAIAAVINADLGAPEISPEQVLNFIKNIGGDDAFKAADVWKVDITDPIWAAKVDAAKLIKKTFAELSNGRVSFTKTRHSPALLKHIIANDVNQLTELLEFIEKLLKMSEVASQS